MRRILVSVLGLFAASCARSELDPSGYGDVTRSANAGGMGSGGGGTGSGGDHVCGGDLSFDSSNCGYCGHSCLGGACVAGTCQPVQLQYLGNTGASALALDAEAIWWASPITTEPKQGGASRVVATAQQGIWGIAVDRSSVFWTNLYGGLVRLPKTGGTAVTIAEGGYRVALDDEYAYTGWTDGVRRVPKDGGTVETLASFGGEGIALDDDFVYFTTWSRDSSGGYDPGLFKVPKNGGAVTALASADCSSYVATFGDMVYWGNQCTVGAVRAVPKSGGPTTVLRESNTPYGIAADAAGVYWAEFFVGSIWMLPTGSTTPITLAAGQFYPRDLAIDAVAVYWTNDASRSAIMKVAKP